MQRKPAFLKDHTFMLLPLRDSYRMANKEQSLNGPTEQTPAMSGKTRTNPTIFSDAEMLSWKPLFLIRHPSAVYSSWLRAEGEPMPDLHTAVSRMFTMLRAQREVFEWYQHQRQHHQGTPTPIVIDADDIMLSSPETPESALHKLCDALGMDKSKLVFSWPADEAARTAGAGIDNGLQGDARVGRFLHTIRSSTGVENAKIARDCDLDACVEEWKQTFGSEAAVMLAERVKESEDDWRYLSRYCLRSG